MQRRMRGVTALTVAILLVSAIALVQGGAAASGGTGEFVVAYADGVKASDARAAIRASGGTILNELDQLRLAQVVTKDASFSMRLMATGKAKGVVRNHSIGTSKRGMPHRYAGERALEEQAASAAAGGQPGGVPNGPKNKKAGPETFSYLQWGLNMVNAPAAWSTTKGEGVLVGIIDTGIDSAHPDLAPNFNAALSRNFTTDIPDIDGPCASDPDGSCTDPADVDEGGHGTHVAGIVAAALNGRGIAGVAPEATLVNLRAGQDSGFFFFFETVAALEYAADNNIDVVNMSFFTDPWLYNCESEDDYVEGEPTEEEIEQQATIREGVLDAVANARDAGVTLVAAAGNDASDLHAATRVDDISPDYPLGTEQHRVVTNNCLDLPSEAPGVIQVSSLGPSGNKSDFSNYGFDEIDVSAPGGWFRDFIGTQDFREPENMILSTYPLEVAREEGAVNKGDRLKDPHFYRQDCVANDCWTYQFLQGTSMASPHATGVVALIISEHGTPDGSGGFDLSPDAVFSILTSTATDTPCPDPEDLIYTDEGRPESWNATCTGTAEYNSIYGHGIVNAAEAAQ